MWTCGYCEQHLRVTLLVCRRKCFGGINGWCDHNVTLWKQSVDESWMQVTFCYKHALILLSLIICQSGKRNGYRVCIVMWYHAGTSDICKWFQSCVNTISRAVNKWTRHVRLQLKWVLFITIYKWIRNQLPLSITWKKRKEIFFVSPVGYEVFVQITSLLSSAFELVVKRLSKIVFIAGCNVSLGYIVCCVSLKNILK